VLSIAQGVLCGVSSYYHVLLHIRPRRKKVRYGVLIVTSIVIIGLLSTNLTTTKTHASVTANWNMNTSTDYTYDNTVQFSAGNAQLKANTWISDEGGASWTYRQSMTIDITGNATLASGYVISGSITGATASTIYSNSLASGNDFRIGFDNGSGIVDVMRDLVTFSSGSIVFYFKTQALLSANDTTHYFIFYKNNSASAPTVDKTQIYNTATNIALSASGSTATASDTYSQNSVTSVNDGFADGTHGSWASNNVATSRVMIKLSTTRKIWKVAQYWGGDNVGGWSKPAGQYFPTGYQAQYTTDNAAVASDALGDAKWTSLSSTTDGLTVTRTPTSDYTPTYPNSPSVSGTTVTSGLLSCTNCWGTTVSNTFNPVSSLSTRFAYTNTGWIGTFGEYFVYPINATEATATPTLSFGAQTLIYPTTPPTIVPNTGQDYSVLLSFTETAGAGSAGTIKYQLSPNGGSTWYWWNGSSWATTTAGSSEANTAAQIDPTHDADPTNDNDPINNFTAGSPTRNFKWKAYLISDGTQQPKIDDISLTYAFDLGKPNNVSALDTAKSQTSGGVDITTNQWYNYPTPHFTWLNPGDPPDGNGVSTGIANYYICFNTNSSCAPYTEGTPQAGLTYTAGSLVSGNTYYLRFKTVDTGGNVSDGVTQPFIYKYDSDKPTNPHYVSASPSGYSSSKAFTFSWPTSNSSAAEDTGGSGLMGYQYKINSDTNWYGSNHTGASNDVIPTATGTVAITTEDQTLVTEGTNIFYLRTVDNAGNVSTSTVQVPFYYSTIAPPALSVIHVNPATNTENSFSFSWGDSSENGDVLNWAGGIAKYYYSFNMPPNSNSAYTALTHIDNQAAATWQGENTVYIVAQDNAGNITWGNYQTAKFYAYTPAPGYPTNLQVSDQSIRATAYKVSLSWSAPTEVGIGVNHYNIYRRIGTGAEAKISESVGRYYLDELQNSSAGVAHYYWVKAVDSAGQVSADSTVVNIIPKGTYQSPASIVKDSTKVVTTSKTATITWQTDPSEEANTLYVHKTDSIVLYGKTAELGSSAVDIDLAANHSIVLKGLEPNTLYYYKVLGKDENGNQTEGLLSQFNTDIPTNISDRTVTDIRQTTAAITWKTNRAATTLLKYGKSTDYSDDVTDVSYNTTHVVMLSGLDAGTKYYYQISGVDTAKDIFTSGVDETFSTLPYPEILDITFQPIATAAATTIEVAWKTNVETDARVQFASTDGKDSREEYDSTFNTDHKFTIGEGKLLDNKTYIFKAVVRDRFGNEATSANQNYTTPVDTRPPVISNFQSEVSVEGAGDTAKVSAIITWETDEPADSQVFYGEGTSGDYSNSTGKDAAMASSHMVVVSDLKAAQTYHVKAVSLDKANNKTESTSQNFVTNQPSQSVVSIILSRLQQTFGWMTSIGGLFGN